ncbi:DUF1302 domain-containing protein [Paracidovorax wautersii]|uniref:DUF1302 domain-containing protein n=1 Tax=Paracidovorax wautersii TaxID=1177982 RepID=A0ABU1I7V1_9BURK|nr:DUF1302 domain-containing protein [Paracidovorax wautersii]MDR6212394.1 hypothetical protein [Paracidovorax wautersii]
MRLHPFALAAVAALGLPAAQAFDIETPDPDIKARLDFTPKVSMGYRVKNPSEALSRLDVGVDPGTVNEDDGNHNFRRGLISRRVDLLTEFDVTGRNFGMRLSGTAWHDGAYTGRNDYQGTPLYAGGRALGPVVSTANNLPGQAPNEFLPATRRQHGRSGEILDAFAYVKGDVGSMPYTLRVGKHTLQWGESLFFGQNGIANAQGPIDIAKIASVPGWQFKEVLLPVEQISGTLRLAEGVQLGAYYQLKWRPSKLPGVGSYFSNQDYVGGGRVNFGTNPDGSPNDLPVQPSADIRPKDSGQGGVQLRWSPQGSEYEFGFYAAQYHDKTPSALVFDFAQGNTHLAYASNIRTFGASVTSSIGQLNWAVEGSMRTNAPLNGDPAVLGGPIPTCTTQRANPCYPVGRTAHLQVSGIYVLQPSALWQGGAVLGELAYNRRLKVTRDIFAIGPDGTWVGLGGLDPNTTKGAFALRMLFEPTYFQVAPGLDLSVPIGFGYNFGGRSSAIANFAGGGSNTGDWTIGLKATYQNVWKFSLTYSDFFGSAKTFTQTQVPGSASPRQLSFGQTLRDRAYVAFSATRTF